MSSFFSKKRTKSESDRNIEIGIVNGENNIKTFYNNLSKMISSDILQLQSIKKFFYVTPLIIEYIELIIETLNNIKERIGIRRSFCVYLLDVEEDKRQSKKSRLETISCMDLKHFYKDFVNIMNFYMKIFKEETDVDISIYRDYATFLTEWFKYEHLEGDHIKNLYAISIDFIKRRYTDKREYDSNYYRRLYDPQFKRSNFSGGQHNKSNYADMNMKYIKELCKANQIKLSQIKNDKRVIYTKKELITKLKRKKII